MDLKGIIENIKEFDIGHLFSRMRHLKMIDLMHWIRHFIMTNVRNVLIGIAVLFVGIIGLIIYQHHLDTINEKATKQLTFALNYYHSALQNKELTSEKQKEYLRNTLGILQQLMGRFPKSRVVSDALFYFGNALFVSQNYDQAIQKFEEYSKKYRKKYLAPYALENIGFCYEQKGDYKKAIEYYDLMKEKYSASSISSKAGLDKGRCYEALNDLNKASESYRSVLTYAPNSIWARHAQVQLGFLESKYKYLSSQIKKVKK